MTGIRSIVGALEVELTSAGLEYTLTAVNEEGIEISRLHRMSELACRFCIDRRSHAKLQKICEKRGDSLRILRRLGLFWTGKAILGRPVLLAGAVFLLAITIFLPSRVLFVRVDGNQSVPEKQILAAAEECGICFGASRRDVRSERVKNALLSAVPGLQWAGVNTSGCVATISVRERADSREETEAYQVSRIVAARDGYILSGTVTQGTGLFSVGQTVKAGQTLISGYTDCGICIQASRAQGEVWAQTNREIAAVTPSSCVQRRGVQDVKRKISLLYRKKRINLWKDSGISGSSCGRMYKEYYITLPGGFSLPIALCVEVYTIYECSSTEASQEYTEYSLSEFARQYLMQQMIAGQIRSAEEAVTLEDGIYRLTGVYTCIEMIGREQREQIGDTNGENS